MTTARIIRKYPNRRLYDTEESRYITLADIRNSVLDDRELVVIDKRTGADITQAIFLQVISDQERRHSAILSKGFLDQCPQDLMTQPQDLSTKELDVNFAEQSKKTLTSGP